MFQQELDKIEANIMNIDGQVNQLQSQIDNMSTVAALQQGNAQFEQISKKVSERYGNGFRVKSHFGLRDAQHMFGILTLNLHLLA